MFLRRDRSAWLATGFFLLVAWFWLINGASATMAVLFAGVLHEAGHLVTLRLAGGAIPQFQLSPFGAVIRTDHLQLSYPRELIAVLAGPAANLCCALLLRRISGTAELWIGANLALCVFNLLPAAPLDGWRLWQLLLAWRLGPDRGEVWAVRIGAWGALLLSVGLVSLMVATGGNLWLLPPAACAAFYGGTLAIRGELPENKKNFIGKSLQSR